MNRELSLVVDAISNEKNISRDAVYASIESALEAVVRKKHTKDTNIVVNIHRDTGNIVATIYHPTPEQIEEYGAERHVPIEHIQEKSEEQVEFGRISAQIAKQVFLQKLKSAENTNLATQMQSQVGKMIHGTIKKITRDSILVLDKNNTTFALPKTEIIGNEVFSLNEKTKGVLLQVASDKKGNRFILSRSSTEYLRCLLHTEIPEISEGLIQIRAIARDPGIRSKVAVKSNDRRLDTVGACLGLKNTRQKSIQQSLGEERVEFIVWTESIPQLLTNLLAPVPLERIHLDEKNFTIDVSLAEENMSQAIGLRGSNIKLASELLGWKIVLHTPEKMAILLQERQYINQQKLSEKLGIALDQSENLIRHEIHSIVDVVNAAPATLANILGITEEKAAELISTAEDHVLMEEFNQMQEESADWMQSVLAESHLQAFHKADIRSREDLADLSVLDVLDICADFSQEQAAALILKARQLN